MENENETKIRKKVKEVDSIGVIKFLKNMESAKVEKIKHTWPYLKLVLTGVFCAAVLWILVILIFSL